MKKREHKLIVGDVVSLKSISPPMTIIRIDKERADCLVYDESNSTFNTLKEIPIECLLWVGEEME